MTRLAYIWMTSLTVFSFAFAASEWHHTDESIDRSVTSALYFGTKNGCERRNHLHGIKKDCDREARKVVSVYLHARR